MSAADSQEPSHEQFELPELTSDAKTWGALCHASALLGLFPLVGFGHLVGPLVVWLIKRNDHPFIDYQGRESLNFQISVLIYGLLLTPLLCVLVGIPLLIALGIADVVLVIMAAIKASHGEAYRYPMTIRFLK
jgi:uncharacterized Tic20 family protein